MARLACVSVPALPLQILLRERPGWHGQPVAVVAEEKAQARVLWVNRLARRQGVRAGLRHAEALSLVGALRAAAVPPVEVAAGVAALTALLRRFSPHVEPSRTEPGVFWLDGSGLHRLYRGARAWSQAIHAALVEAGFHATVAAGFSRFGSYATARARQGALALPDAAAERVLVRTVPLERLGLAPQERDALEQLGIRTVAGLLTLPATGLLARFGPELHRLHRQAAGLLAEPLQPSPEPVPLRERLVLEPPERDATRLLFRLKPRLEALLDALAVRGQALEALRLHLALDDNGTQAVRLKPAVPTLDATLLLELLRLRLDALTLSAGVVELALEAEAARAATEQLSLFAQRPRRDLAAGDRALARLRAELGEEAVGRVHLREGHLPEARFGWEPVARLTAPAARPEPDAAPQRALVRRVLPKPRPLPGWPRDPERWLPERAPLADALVRLSGPYTVSGGWWVSERHRDYYFAETRRGELLWVYHDRRRGRWFLQGRVE